MVSFALAGCGRLGFGQHPEIDSGPPDADRFGMFTNAQPMANVSSTAREFGSSISNDELELYFISNRGTAGYALYRATRASRADAFGAPVIIPIGGAQVSGEPALARGGLEMFLSYGSGPARTVRTSPQGPWAAAITDASLAAYSGLDLGAGDLHLVMFDSMSNQLYEATRPDAASAWSTPSLIVELANITAYQNYPTMTDDGLEILWQAYSTPSAPGLILHAVRPALDQPFGAATSVVDVPGMSVGDPGVSADGRTLYFSASTLADPVDSDLWVADRP